MALYAMVAFLSSAIGVGVGWWFLHSETLKGPAKPAELSSDPGTANSPGPAIAKNSPEPWFKTQSPPPALVEAPSEPILPETVMKKDSTADGKDRTSGNRPRAYEESLPETIYRRPESDTQTGPLTALPGKAPETRGKDIQDTPTWVQNSLVFDPKPDRSLIAIVIDDMGLDPKRTEGILSLPGPLTVSYLTYADNLAFQTRNAKARGHEVMAHVSMEPISKDIDPGPNVLLTNHEASEIRNRLSTGLDQGEEFVGVNNHMGSKFTQNPELMAVVMEVLAERGLIFLDSRTSASTTGPEVAAAYGVPFLVRNIFLDNQNEKALILKNLEKVESLAQEQGYAIAIGHPRSGTIGALADWVGGLDDKGLQLVPISTIMKRQSQDQWVRKD